MEIRSYIYIALRYETSRQIFDKDLSILLWTERKQVGEESDSSGSERSPKQAKRRNRGGAPPATRRRKSGISARERNLRRLESNERERMRMHSLNDAFEVTVYCFLRQLSLRRVDERDELCWKLSKNKKLSPRNNKSKNNEYDRSLSLHK